MKKRPLRSSKEIFHKLRWNGSIPLNQVSIGYMDRQKGMQEIAFERFKPDGRIPFNRVYYFKWEQVLIWDREQRMDLVFGSGETAPGERLVMSQVETAGVAAEFQPLPVYHFDAQAGEWAQGTGEASPDHQHSIRVVSYNVLRTDQELKGVNHQRRIPQLIRQLDRLRPDVIALQEVMEPFREMLFRLAWVRQEYWSTLADKSLKPGQMTELILSRHAPLQGMQLAFSPAKRSTGIRISLNGQDLDVVTLHLPSDLAVAASERRKIYLRQLNHALKPSPAALLLGDFNQSSESILELLPGFKDLWPLLNPQKPGLTFDPQTNSIARTLAGSKHGARLDRVLLKAPGSRLLPLGMEVLRAPVGQAPFSDHFGLETELICDSSFTTLANSPTTYETALVALPPLDKWADIQAIRREYDPRFERWMPHFTLLYGFLPEALFSASTVLLQQALSEQVPFRVALQEFGQFDQSNSTTLWLKPDPVAEDRFHNLQEVLQTVFPGCQDQERHGEFRPHLTLATIQGPNRWRAGLLRKRLEQYWEGVEFEVEAVALLSREGGGPFRVHSVVTLGDEDVALTPKDYSAEQTDLETALGAKGLLTGAGWVKQKSQALERFKQLLRSWSSSARVFSIGLDAMGVHLGSLPLDLIVLGRHDFPAFRKWWEGESNVLKEKQLGEDQRGGFLQGDLNGLIVRLRYLPCPTPLPLLAPNRMTTEDFNAFPLEDQPLMQASLELAALRHHVGLHVPIFNVTVQAICLWAQKRGLTWEAGFFSEETWALMVAWVDPEETAEQWLQACFSAFLVHDWRQPFGDGPGMEDSPMQVWSLAVPPLNKTGHIDSRKLERLLTHFQSALEEMYAIHQSQGDWMAFLIEEVD